MNIVAEGVEKKEQFHFLLHQGCHQIQGYLYSKPVKEDEFKKLLYGDGPLVPLIFPN